MGGVIRNATEVGWSHAPVQTMIMHSIDPKLVKHIQECLKGLHGSALSGPRIMREIIDYGTSVCVLQDCVIRGTEFKRTYRIRYFGVHPRRRRKGYGSRKLREFENLVKKAGFTRITLSAYQGDTAARPFWRKNGYTVYRREAYRVLMEKKLA